MAGKVSVVLPIYNVEKYLNKCITSVVNQTYKELEIILVDDGAKDNCPQICDKWATMDERIKVVHKENGGLASARNAGYLVATGKYLMYIDSDDSLKLDIIEVCVNEIERSDADIVIYGYEKTDEDGNVLETYTWDNKILEGNDIVHYLYKGICEMSFGYAWNKLYKKEVLDASGVIADPKIIDREDLVYNLELVNHMKKIAFISNIGYEYLQRSSSLLHNGNLARVNGIKYFVDRIASVDVKNNDVNKKLFNTLVLHYLSDCIIKNIMWNKEVSNKEKKAWINKIIDKCPHINKLYYDCDNSRYINVLFKTIEKKKPKYFYWYVKFSELKRRFK